MFETAEKEGQMFIIFFLPFLSAVVPATLSRDRLSASRPWKLRPTSLEVSSLLFSLFTIDDPTFIGESSCCCCCCVHEVFSRSTLNPTDPFAALEFQNWLIDVSELHKFLWSTSLGALIFWKGRWDAVPDISKLRSLKIRRSATLVSLQNANRLILRL